MNLDSLRYRLEKVSEQLAETKMAQTFPIVSADKAHQLAEKEKLEHEVQQDNEQAVQQTRRLNLQDAEKASLGETVREYADTVKALRLQIKRLQLEHDVKVTILQRHAASSRRDRTRWKTGNGNSSLKRIYKQQRQHLGGQLLKKNKEIEELKCKLARQPDDAIYKHQECQKHNRHLNKMVMASHAFLTAHEVKNKEVEEETKRLTDNLKKLKLEYKQIHLPPISKLPPFKDKSNDTYSTNQKFGHTFSFNAFSLFS